MNNRQNTREHHFVNLNEIRSGLKSGIPILIGYLPIAIAFGVLSKNTGLTIKETFLFSALVFAGASQFMAINLMAIGTGAVEIIITTLLVNLRHFLMSASLASSIEEKLRTLKYFVAFGVTDEVFSVAALRKEPPSRAYLLSLEFVAYSSWVGGTVLGFIAGSILPEQIRASLNIALYAMFAALLIPEARKSSRVMILASLSAILNIILSCVLNIQQGWSIVFSVITASIAGVYLFENKEAEEYEQ